MFVCSYRSVSKSVNAYYLETVASGKWEEVQALFNCVKADQTLILNKNYVNQRDEDALRIAIDNEDLPMLKFLLHNQVYAVFIHYLLQAAYSANMDVYLEI